MKEKCRSFHHCQHLIRLSPFLSNGFSPFFFGLFASLSAISSEVKRSANIFLSGVDENKIKERVRK